MRWLMSSLVALVAWLLAALPPVTASERITIAAAADLKLALDEVVAAFRESQPEAQITVIYGSSGKFHTQIRQGAPYDLYFSADIDFPNALHRDGFAASEVKPYAIGRIVLWSTTEDASRLTLEDLADPRFTRIAVANPRHAPYGMRAIEAFESVGILEAVQPRLVYGENIAQTAQFVETGNAQVGVIALALAIHPSLAEKGGHALIPDDLHLPLNQGFIITRRAAGNRLAQRFADYMDTPEARAIMTRYGFILPESP